MNLFLNENDLQKEKYFVVTYKLESNKNLRDAAWNIAIGQSVGNPNVRNRWETEDMFRNHSCLILADEHELQTKKTGEVKIAFPVINTDWETDGISHLLCQVMGGHVDIDLVKKCRAINIDFPNSVISHFRGPKFGITGMRKFTGQYDKPLFGAIIKPKIGISPETLLDMVKELVDGGVDFIKEDEIMSNPSFCPLDKRVGMISNYLHSQSRNVVFCHTINCDPHVLENRVRRIHDMGGNGVHINVWSGYGSYNSIRKLDLPIYLHFQSSGAKVVTNVNHQFSISWPVICQLATMMGVDTIQTGMVGGYSNDNPEEILNCIDILRRGNTLPALSCGLHPGLIDEITSLVGNDYLGNAGGSVHGHPNGTLSGSRAMRQAIDKTYGKEYDEAIQKWGKVQPKLEIKHLYETVEYQLNNSKT
jgi:ribulose-bisphosphate carboxylase large chain